MGLLLLLTIASARRAACLGPVPPARGLSLLRLRSGGGEAASPAGIWSLSAADLRIAGSAACGSYIQGYTTGVLGGSLLFLVPRFGLSPRAVGAVATATTLGSVVGTAAAARLADAAGRRRTMALSSLLFVAAGLLLCWTPGLGVLLAARFLGGVGVGACGAVARRRRGARAPPPPPRTAAPQVVPVYVAECASPESRGALSTLRGAGAGAVAARGADPRRRRRPQLMISSGALTAMIATLAAALADGAGLLPPRVAPFRAVRGRDVPEFGGSSLGRCSLVSADFWSRDHPSDGLEARALFPERARAARPR